MASGIRRLVYAVDLADDVASVVSGAYVVEDHAVDLVTGSRCFAMQVDTVDDLADDVVSDDAVDAELAVMSL